MFPFPITKPKFSYPFGVKVLPEGMELLIQSECYDDEIALKQKLLKKDRELYFQLTPIAENAAIECVKVLSEQSSWLDPSLLEETNPASALESLGSQVQEDLLLIDGGEDLEFRLIGGVVCFPSGWSIQDKIGQSMSKIHLPVPSFEEKLMKPTAKLLGSLKPERPVWRVNWGLRPSDQLDQSPQYSSEMDRLAADIRPEEVGERCFFRLEYQTLSRLPDSGHILFTIHTRQTRLEEIEIENLQLLLSNLQTCPDEILKYKGIWPMKDSVIQYMAQRLGQQ